MCVNVSSIIRIFVEELYSVTSHQATQSSPTSSRVSSDLSEDVSDGHPATNLTATLLKMFNTICLDNCHLVIFTTILVSLIFVLAVFSIIVLCRRKNNYAMKSRQQGWVIILNEMFPVYQKNCFQENAKTFNLLILSQGISNYEIHLATKGLAVSSISLDDMPVMSAPRSPVSVLHNSPFYSPVRESPSQGPASTFSTFHPQLRTSPEGSSCGDTDLDLDLNKSESCHV